jgi:hypothetical protein
MLAAGSTACTSTLPPMRTLTTVSGDNQLLLVGASGATPPKVKLTDQDGQPVSGVTVTFAAVGRGLVTGAAPVTGSDGTATLGSWAWTAGELGTHKLIASAPDTRNSPDTVTSMVVEPGLINRLSGELQVALAGSPVALPLTAIVKDVTGAPLIGVTVTFAADNNGSVTPASTKTDSLGIATVTRWTLGPVAGGNRLFATVTWPASPSISFFATGTAAIRK